MNSPISSILGRSLPTAFLTIALTVSGVAQENKRYLIIHADDAGMSHSVNRATIEAMEHGIVTSASIMVPCPWFPEFAAYAAAHPDNDYGIHLTLNAEWEHYRWGPVAHRERVPSLTDERGFLWDNVQQVAENVKAEEAAIELRAQIDRAKSFGVPLTHLDTHMGALVSRPDLLEVYVNLGLEYDLPVLFVQDSGQDLAARYPALAERGQAMQQLLQQRGLPLLDHLGQFYGGSSHEERVGRYHEFLRTLKPGVSELIIHCGYDGPELRAITSSATRRDGDRRIFTDPKTAALIRDLEIELISWKQLREVRDNVDRSE